MGNDSKISSVKIQITGTEPAPMPKKQYRVFNKNLVSTYERDPKGKAQEWRDAIYYAVVAQLPLAFSKYKRGEALFCLLNFYITKPKSNKDILPCRKPDLDNYSYLVRNVLQEGFWKDRLGGYIYEDDSQIVCNHEAIYWATDLRGPGCEIFISKAELIEGQIFANKDGE